ncbi:helix-turn-helix transcriptional regulator [Psychrobium sp. MM17-31]|uniref:winged helix-turn-helix transcriptional regulator n=1 Tax=Psychrobium sp. MM17-31 TaxID=2917758 RepID=UPI001EF43469|nr:helix-turn-helix domain-containing protein [Psychrobium sp. MM17-31]MCG7532069.1 helix-turn-helix transcriptional regulator [Psychrobium sp. MM17-31]
MTKRSDCPIAHALDIFGDKWSLLILRDMLFFAKTSFSELQQSDEKIATNILSSRLEHLEKQHLLSKTVNPNDKRKKHYQLTQQGIDLLPIILEIMVWSHTYQADLMVPAGMIERIKNDRQSLIAQLKQQLQKSLTA